MAYPEANLYVLALQSTFLDEFGVRLSELYLLKFSYALKLSA